MIPKDSYDPQTFCPLPFTHIEMNPDGRFRPCCKSNFDKIDHIDSHSKGDVWNTPVLKRMRKQLFNGEKPKECSGCFKIEETGAVSLRQKNLRSDGEHMKRFNSHSKFDMDTMHSYSKPSHVKLSLSNECNLQCRMCNPLYSSRWERAIRSKKAFKEYIEDSRFLQGMEYELSTSKPELEITMLNFLEKNKSEIERLDFLGGEPFLQNKHVNALQVCQDQGTNIRLEYSSNLTTFGNQLEEVLQLWKKYKSVEITVSLDGPPQVSEYIRHGSKTDKIISNINFLRQRTREENIELRLLGGCAFSVHNTPFFVETVQFIVSLGLEFVINFVTSPEFQSPQVLPSEVKKEMTEKFTSFKNNPEQFLEKSFAANDHWLDQGLRKTQTYSITKQLESLIIFMNAEDKSSLYEESKKFDRHFDELYSSKKIVESRKSGSQ